MSVVAPAVVPDGRAERHVRRRPADDRQRLGRAPPDPPVGLERYSTKYEPDALAAREPAAGDRLLAGEELHRVGAVRVQVAQEGVLPAREGEERHGRGHADVHAHHPGLHLVPVAADRGSRLREDRGAVAEAAAVHHRDRLVERCPRARSPEPARRSPRRRLRAGTDVGEDRGAHEGPAAALGRRTPRDRPRAPWRPRPRRGRSPRGCGRGRRGTPRAPRRWTRRRRRPRAGPRWPCAAARAGARAPRPR